MRLTDTHCHLDFDRFDQDREKVIKNAIDSGVERFLVPGIDLDSSAAAIKLAEQYPEIYAGVGVHPNSGMTWQSGTLTQLRDLAKHPKVVAIGEIGLDYYREWTPHNIQKKIFNSQLELATEMKLPIVVHDREASQDLYQMLAEWKAQATNENGLGVLHSYSGDSEQAKLALELGFYIGISGPVTFKNAQKLREVVKLLPEDKMLIETDAPYLTPYPYRGKRNQPGYVKHIAEQIAVLRECAPSEIGDQTTRNGKQLFNW